MRIAICDDEPIFVKKLYNYLWQQPNCSVDCFLSPLELLEVYQNGAFYDVIFLDIMMDSIDGIRLAKEIRAYDTRVVLVFLTAYPEYAPSGYEVRAFRYLLKPITKESVITLMHEIQQDFHRHHKILLKTAECNFLLHTDDIYYIEANNKDCSIFYQKDTIILRKVLNELEEQLSNTCFFRIHRKYLINLAHVREYDEIHVTLDCGKTLPISRRKSQKFRSALESYIEGGFY